MSDVKDVEAETEQKDKEYVTLKVLIDFILLAVYASTLAFFWLFTEPFYRGYFCDDPTLSLPVKPSTVPSFILWPVCLLTPTILIVAVELATFFLSEAREESNIYFLGFKVPTVVHRIYMLLHLFIFGAFMTEITTSFLKFIVGRPRPSFMATCIPDYDCSSAPGPNTFVEDYSCTNPELVTFREKKDVRQSFPSGHTAFSTYAMTFAILYLHKCLDIKFSDLFTPLIQWGCVLLGLFISLSRLTDHKHHWSDIFAGFILGFIIGCFLIFTKTDLYKEPKKKKRS